MRNEICIFTALERDQFLIPGQCHARVVAQTVCPNPFSIVPRDCIPCFGTASLREVSPHTLRTALNRVPEPVRAKEIVFVVHQPGWIGMDNKYPLQLT